MKVLIATNETQGSYPGDYAWTVEGELVTVGSLECCRPDACGCGRGFCGVGSSRATTTAMVVERPDLTIDDLRDAVEDWLEQDGWTALLEDATELADLVDGHVHDIITTSEFFPAGAVVRRQGTLVFDAVDRAA